MSEYYTIGIFKGLTRERAPEVIEAVSSGLFERVDWNHPPSDGPWIRTGHASSIATVRCTPSFSRSFELFRRMGLRDELPWIQLQFSASAVWGYTLFRADEILDSFSVSTKYWTDIEESMTKQEASGYVGQPQVVADVWEIEVNRIANYFRQWTVATLTEDAFSFAREGRAYPEDEYMVGDPGQCLDFLRALGGTVPDQSHRLVVG